MENLEHQDAMLITKEAVVEEFNPAISKKPIYYYFENKNEQIGKGKFVSAEDSTFHLDDVVNNTGLGKLYITNSHETGKPAAYLLLATNFPGYNLELVEFEPFSKQINKPDGLIAESFKRHVNAKDVALKNQPIEVLQYQVKNRAVTNHTVIEHIKKAINKQDTLPTALQKLQKELESMKRDGTWGTASVFELTEQDLQSNLMVYLRKKQEAKIPAKKVKTKQMGEKKSVVADNKTQKVDHKLEQNAEKEDNNQGAQHQTSFVGNEGLENLKKSEKKSKGADNKIQKTNPESGQKDERKVANKEAQSSQWVIPEDWHGIIGQERAVGELEDIIADQGMSEERAKWGQVYSDRGFLFYGPGGTGKSSLGKSMAEAMGAKLITFSAGQDSFDTIGTTVVQARKKFDEAKKIAKSGQKVVILLDEVEKFIADKTKGNVSQSSETSGFMTLVEEVLAIPKTSQQIRLYQENGFNNIVIIGTTNHLQAIEVAAMRPGRFGRKIECFLPTTNDERRDLIIHSTLPTIKSANTWRIAHNMPKLSFKDYFSFTYEELSTRSSDLAGYSQNEIDSGTRDALDYFIRTKPNDIKYRITLPELFASIIKTKAGKRYVVETESILVEDPAWPTIKRWHGIIGQESAIENFKLLAENLNFPTDPEDIWGSTPSNRGFILYGPTGTGKTSLGMAMAAELGAEVVLINAGKDTFNTIGTEEMNVKLKFDEAKVLARTGKKVVILFDEVEKFIAKKSNATSLNPTLDKYYNDKTSAIMTLVEEVLTTPKTRAEKERSIEAGINNIIIIGTTNHLDYIEEAAIRPKRFGRKIECGLPKNSQERRDLILNATLPTISEANSIRSTNKLPQVGFSDYFEFTNEELLSRCSSLENITQAEIEAGVEASMAKLLRMKKVDATTKLKLTDLISEIQKTI